MEKALSKKCKELAVLGSSLVYKEKEVLLGYQQKLEQSKADRNPRGYEKKALLEETDSDDDTIPSTLDFDDYEESKEMYRGESSLQRRRCNERNGVSDEEEGRQQVLQEEEEFKMEATETFMTMRGQKIEKVAQSLNLVHKMYQSLNEIVDQQGVTLTRIEDNVAEAQFNTKAAHGELKKALVNEKTLKQRFKQGDLSVNCLVFLFGFVVVMSIMDFLVNGPDVLITPN